MAQSEKKDHVCMLSLRSEKPLFRSFKGSDLDCGFAPHPLPCAGTWPSPASRFIYIPTKTRPTLRTIAMLLDNDKVPRTFGYTRTETALEKQATLSFLYLMRKTDQETISFPLVRPHLLVPHKDRQSLRGCKDIQDCIPHHEET